MIFNISKKKKFFKKKRKLKNNLRKETKVIFCNFFLKNINSGEIKKKIRNKLNTFYTYRNFFKNFLEIIKVNKKIEETTTPSITNKKLNNKVSEVSLITLNQKNNNTKSVFFLEKNILTISVGTILGFFNFNTNSDNNTDLQQNKNKFLRKSLKGTKIFLNFLKNILEKVYINKIKASKMLLFNCCGYNYNLFKLNKVIRSFFLMGGVDEKNIFFLFNIKVSFSKNKNKKVKSIKKRLKKKILSFFLKSF